MFLRSLLGGVRATPTMVRPPLLNMLPKPAPVTFPFGSQQRWASNLGPRRTKYRKAHKGRVSFPTGGSVKGTTVSQGIYGIRTLEPCRLSATQLSAAETALKRKLKVVRGSQVFMRVFPDVPVCVKGNETRMGKGKGSFEYWACRYVAGSYAIGGHVEVRKEVAKEALRLAAAKLPIRTEFVTVSTPPRLGREVDANLAANAVTPKSAQP
ncbi:hypothetical protein CBS9595_003811 [Malassezia furfur]|nr:hypothetical protein CBS9595_003811 [Malassezia furfur]